MTIDSLARAIEAAAEALHEKHRLALSNPDVRDAARIAVEAAAPHLCGSWLPIRPIQERAERAEFKVEQQEKHLAAEVSERQFLKAEVERLREILAPNGYERDALIARAERAEATADALSDAFHDEQVERKRAEAEAGRLRVAAREWSLSLKRQWEQTKAERALADRLAEALRMSVNGVCGWSDAEIAALVAWEEARRG